MVNILLPCIFDIYSPIKSQYFIDVLERSFMNVTVSRWFLISFVISVYCTGHCSGRYRDVGGGQGAWKLAAIPLSNSLKSPEGCTCNYIWTFDWYGPVRNAFDAGKSITWASGRGLGRGNLDFFGPQMAFAITVWSPKKSWLPGPNPLSLALLMPASKALCTGHRSIK